LAAIEAELEVVEGNFNEFLAAHKDFLYVTERDLLPLYPNSIIIPVRVRLPARTSPAAAAPPRRGLCVGWSCGVLLHRAGWNEEESHRSSGGEEFGEGCAR
jgi:hypothetical protein